MRAHPEHVGVGKISPNPLRVIRQDPLAVPPNLELRPPVSTAQPAPGAGNATGAGEGADAGPSQAEAALLDAVGADDADPEIRLLLERDRELRDAEEAEGGLLGRLNPLGWLGGEDDEEMAETASAEQEPDEDEGGGLLDLLDIFDWSGDDDDDDAE